MLRNKPNQWGVKCLSWKTLSWKTQSWKTLSWKITWLLTAALLLFVAFVQAKSSPKAADAAGGGSPGLPGQNQALLKTEFDAKLCTIQIDGRTIKLYGTFQIVDSFPDFKVKLVDSFADLKVQRVNSFPDKCGKWQEVQSFPDFKIQLVSSFPDLTVEYVDNFPGTRFAIRCSRANC